MSSKNPDLLEFGSQFSGIKTTGFPDQLSFADIKPKLGSTKSSPLPSLSALREKGSNSPSWPPLSASKSRRST
ncbi:hypothetical protein PMG11_05861 [Penicillium brasilianum]|uniref:Uncharacterized protein n=1 Tax=Penicillium brasilianum TaxID=104259 RepID=A0A0F7TMQ3_PENBI|nr:hypothetical protein PMG11_05861 [Penicillium brasilianum]